MWCLVRIAHLQKVGNIPYDVSEEQLINVFSEVGRVVDFRLVNDRDQGKFKGYGFCEYEAVRNLNDVEVGGRPLRLDFAEVDPVLDGGDRAARGRTPNGVPPLPSGVLPPPGVSSTDAITRTIASLPPHQLIDILTQMKSLTAHAPEQARSLLTANPQLAYAVFHAMLMMNVVDPMVVRRVLGETGMTPSIPPTAPMAPTMQPVPPASHPMAPMPVQAPMEPSPPVPTPAPPPQLDEQQRMLLQQVLQLTPEQINALPPDQRASILQLKAQFGH